MRWLGVVIRVGMLWALSILVALAGMEIARGVVVAIDCGTTTDTARGQVPVVSVDENTVRPAPSHRF